MLRFVDFANIYVKHVQRLEKLVSFGLSFVVDDGIFGESFDDRVCYLIVFELEAAFRLRNDGDAA